MGCCTSVGLDALVKRMDRGEFDLVAVGRALISDPQWVEKIHLGEGELRGYEMTALGELV